MHCTSEGLAEERRGSVSPRSAPFTPPANTAGRVRCRNYCSSFISCSSGNLKVESIFLVTLHRLVCTACHVRLSVNTFFKIQVDMEGNGLKIKRWGKKIP